MMRKIELMHYLFGVVSDHKCEECQHLIKGRYNTQFFRKCCVYGATHSEASDWRKKWVACGLFNKEWNGGEIIRVSKMYQSMQRKVEDSKPMMGQISFWGDY